MIRRQQRNFIISFLLPGVLLYTVFVFYPAIQGVLISLLDWSGLSMRMSFSGLENYQTLWKELTDADDYYNVRRYLWNNMFLFVSSLIAIVLGLAAAALIHSKPRGYNLFRITYFFPQVLAVPAIAVLWAMVLNPNFGLVNSLLRGIGFESAALPWLSLQHDLPFAKLGMYAVAFIGIWAALGWYMILFLASIQNIPSDYTEAARIDGATGFQAFRFITIPLIWETVHTVLIFAVMGMFGAFALPYILFGQQPSKHSDVIYSYYYWQAFGNNNWGYAAAIIVSVTVVTLIATLITYFALKRESVQY